MKINRTAATRSRDRLAASPFAVAALVSLLALGGCASFDVPDAINPGKWDFFADDEEVSDSPSSSIDMDTPMDMSSDVSLPDPASEPPSPMAEAPPPPAAPTMAVEESIILSEPEPVAAIPTAPSLRLRPPSTASALQGEPFSTVVITSGGISTAEPVASSMMTPMEPFSNVAQMPQGNVQVQFPQPGKTTGKRPQEAVGGMLRLATIYFNNNSDTLDRRDLDIVAAVAQLRKERGGRLFVVGHASSRTQDMEYVRHTLINFNISSKRANSIAGALGRAGVAEDHIQVHAVSDAVPLYYEVMPSGEAGNRRVEIYLAP